MPLNNPISNSDSIHILDVANNFTSDNVEGALAEIANKSVVNVEDFSGTNDLEKIQNAINYANEHDRIVEFTKLYDITGLGSIYIDAGSGYIAGHAAKNFYIVGNGGGIKKDDSGYVFDNTFLSVGYRVNDINISGMSYESAVKNTETHVWNLDHFYSINSHHNTYRGIDSVARCDTKSSQSNKFSNENIKYGNGYAFYFFRTVDTTISDCLVEARNSGWGYSGGAVSNTVSSSNTLELTSNYNLRIINNIFEGMELTGVKLGNCMSSTISGNYMEINGSYFDLFTLVDPNNYHSGLNFASNHITQTIAQDEDNVPALKIKNILGYGGTLYNQKSNSFFYGNRSKGILYETESYINSIGDVTNRADGLICNPMNFLIPVSGYNTLPDIPATGRIKTILSGVIASFRKTYSIALSAGEEKTVAVDIINAYFYEPVNDDSVVSISSTNLEARVLNYNWVFKSANISTINLVLKNNNANSGINSTININVMNPRY